MSIKTLAPMALLLMSGLKKCFICFCLATCMWHPVNAQSLQVSRWYDIKDGLPSNVLYALFQDSKGFLWIGTDNGLSRFDGRFFKNYGVESGLPDRDIFCISEEKDGTLWVSSYKTTCPVYFDETTNTFKKPKGVRQLQHISSKLVYIMEPLPEGGIGAFDNNSNIQFVIKNKTIEKARPNILKWYYRNSIQPAQQRQENISIYSTQGYIFYHSKKNDVSFHDIYKGGILTQNATSDSFYFRKYNSNRLYILSQQKDAIKSDSITVKNYIKSVRAEFNNVIISTSENEIYTYSKKKLQQTAYIKLDENCLFAYADRSGNIWVPVFGKGMVLLSPQLVKQYNTQNLDIDQRFRSIFVTDRNDVYAGNYFGCIYSTKKNASLIRLLATDGATRWIKQVLLLDNKVISFVDPSGIYFDSQKTDIKLDGRTELSSIKTAQKLNEKTIIVGISNVTGGLHALDIKTKRIVNLNSPEQWVSAIAIFKNRFIYYGGNGGLYKYDYEKRKHLNAFIKSPLQGERILDVTVTPSGLVIAATVNAGICIIENDSIKKIIPYSRITEGLLNCIKAYDDSSVWIGTNKGLIKLNYTFKNNDIDFTVWNYAVLGSLLEKNINALFCNSNKLYFATDGGVGYINSSLRLNATDINLILTEVKINNVIIPVADSFYLKANQSTVSLEFAGIDLNANVRQLQYCLDTGNSWTDIAQNKLNMALAPGRYHLQVRTINAIGIANAHTLKLYFNILPPLYARGWFIMLYTALTIAGISLIYFRIKRKQRERLFRNREKIEQERNRITADLHDEIGASLSSLQLYSDAVLKVLDEDIDKSRTIIKKISTQAYYISDKISDIIWSIKPMGETTMSLERHLKNCISNLLDETDIRYSISIDHTMENRGQNIVFRKNIILVIKEAINNCIKHSQARKIEITLKMENSILSCIIQDDGIGIDPNAEIAGGNGLYNIKARVKEMNGTIILNTAINDGVAILITIPSENVYELPK